MTDPFADVFGDGRTTNSRPRVKVVAKPGLTVVLRKDDEWCFFGGPLPRGSELTVRTQHTDPEKAKRSAYRQLQRKHKRERPSHWSVVDMRTEQRVARQSS